MPLPKMRRPAAAWGIATLICEIVVTWITTAEPARPSNVRHAFVLAQCLMLLGFLAALVRMVTHMDELQKRIALESVFVAFVGSLALVFVFSGLAEAGVWRSRWDWIAPAMMAVWAIGYVYSSSKYR
jgi:hypothetical protein